MKSTEENLLLCVSVRDLKRWLWSYVWLFSVITKLLIYMSSSTKEQTIMYRKMASSSFFCVLSLSLSSCLQSEKYLIWMNACLFYNCMYVGLLQISITYFSMPSQAKRLHRYSLDSLLTQLMWETVTPIYYHLTSINPLYICV